MTLAALIPGRQRAIAAALGRQRHAAAVDALLRLPSTVPGVVEGLFRAVRGGVRREHARDPESASEAPASTGWTSPALIALEFRRSRARQFPALLRRAQLAFGAALERLEFGAGGLSEAMFRVSLAAPPARVDGDDALARWRPTTPGASAEEWATLAAEFTWLHGQLARLRGSRLWINGWCFPHTRAQGEVTPAVQVHLLRAWFEWARSARGTSP